MERKVKIPANHGFIGSRLDSDYKPKSLILTFAKRNPEGGFFKSITKRKEIKIPSGQRFSGLSNNIQKKELTIEFRKSNNVVDARNPINW